MDKRPEQGSTSIEHRMVITALCVVMVFAGAGAVLFPYVFAENMVDPAQAMQIVGLGVAAIFFGGLGLWKLSR